MPSSYDLLPWLPELLNCRQCACRDEAKRVVPGVGPLDAGIAFIGQNPGSDEDEAGIPFVGESGKMLNQWIALMGLRRDRVLVTNAVKCHTDRNRKPRKREMDTCQDAWLRRELESFEALRVLIPLGRPALEAVVGKVEALPPVMTSWWMTASFHLPGKGIDADFKEFHILPLPHPSYLLRYPTHQSRLNQLLLPGVVKYLEENFPDVYTRARR